MPAIQFRTNLPKENITKEFHRQFLVTVAEALNRDKKICSITIETGLMMSRGEDFNPYCELYIICPGINTKIQTQAITEKMTAFITTHTGIPAARVGISFCAPERFMLAINGAVFGDSPPEV